MAMTAADIPVDDGRAARAARTKTRIAEAMLALLAEGHLRPTAPLIAERAGVSLRSVFQRFDDMEALYAEVASLQFARVFDAVQPVPRVGALAERIARLAGERARLHEAIAPVRRAAVLVEPFSAELQARLRLTRAAMRQETAAVFHDELAEMKGAARRQTLEAVVAITSWPAWEELRAHQGLSRAQAQAAVERAVCGLLGARYEGKPR